MFHSPNVGEQMLRVNRKTHNCFAKQLCTKSYFEQRRVECGQMNAQDKYRNTQIFFAHNLSTKSYFNCDRRACLRSNRFGSQNFFRCNRFCSQKFSDLTDFAAKMVQISNNKTNDVQRKKERRRRRREVVQSALEVIDHRMMPMPMLMLMGGACNSSSTH
jgi:hypothetical protein